MLKYLSKILFILPASGVSLLPLIFSFVLVSFLEVFGIGVIGPFIGLASTPDIITETPWLNRFYMWTGFSTYSQFIALLGLAIVVVFLLKSFVSWRVQTGVFAFTFKQKGELTARLMKAYLSAPYVFHLSKNSSHIIQNIITETKQFANGVLIPLLTSISNCFVVAALVSLLLATDFVTIVVVLGMVLPLVFFFNSFKKKLSLWGKQSSQAEQSTIRVINHGLGSIKDTKIIGCESYFEQQVAHEAQIYTESVSKFFAYRLSPRIMIETLLVIFLVGLVSVYLMLHGDIQQLTPTLSVFALASIRLIPAVSNITSGISTLRNSSFAVNKLYTDLKEVENLPSRASLSSRTSAAPVLTSPAEVETGSCSPGSMPFHDEICLDQVSYQYPAAADLSIRELSLSIKKGESIALIGKSGAGKTTLVDIILGLLEPQTGDIRVDGTSIYDNVRGWQSLIGYIPQSIFLTDETIEHNIAFGVPVDQIDQNQVREVIKAVQLSELIESLPDGVNTLVGERGVLLSGGQRQRIGIARALYHGREILVLDEATAALDNETEALVTEAIKSLSGTKTMIIIAHRLTTVEHCDRIYEMGQGRIVRSGSYQDVVLNKA